MPQRHPMRSHDTRVRGQSDDWRFSPGKNAVEVDYPSARQRTAAAITGIGCALAFYAWVVPPAMPIKPGQASERAMLTRVVPDALRALTGLAASRSSRAAQRAGAVPGAGIRN